MLYEKHNPLIPTSNGKLQSLFEGEQRVGERDAPPQPHRLVEQAVPIGGARRIDLGAVVSDQEAEVEVWNAAIDRAQILEEITVDGPTGIEVTDHLGLPAHFPASRAEVYRSEEHTSELQHYS